MNHTIREIPGIFLFNLNRCMTRIDLFKFFVGMGLKVYINIRIEVHLHHYVLRHVVFTLMAKSYLAHLIVNQNILRILTF